MTIKTRAKVEGLRELDAALGDLKKSTAKGILARVLRKAGKPIAAAAENNAPVLSGDLKASIGVSTKLSKRQKKGVRKARSKSFAEVHVGPAASERGHLQEFGTDDHGAQPYMRPAWDANKDRALGIIKEDLGDEIERTAERARRRAARLLRKAKS